MLKKTAVAFLLTVLLSAGCGKTTLLKPTPEPALFPDSRYLTAEGSGQTELEARRQALAALSAIFESRVHAETTSFARSAIGPDNDELFEKNVESKIAVVSSVELTGAKIGHVWQTAEATAPYHALAVIDRAQAGRGWADKLETVTAETGARVKALEHTRGRFRRLVLLNQIVSGLLQKQALESRLRVLKHPARATLDVDTGQITDELAVLRSSIRLHVEIDGDDAQSAADQMSAALAAKGFLISTAADSADALVKGFIKTHPLELNNPRIKFVRAVATVKIVETGTGAIVGKLNESVRKGHVDTAEATRRAVLTIARRLSEKLVLELGFNTGDASY